MYVFGTPELTNMNFKNFWFLPASRRPWNNKLRTTVEECPRQTNNRNNLLHISRWTTAGRRLANSSISHLLLKCEWSPYKFFIFLQIASHIRLPVFRRDGKGFWPKQPLHIENIEEIKSITFIYRCVFEWHRWHSSIERKRRVYLHCKPFKKDPPRLTFRNSNWNKKADFICRFACTTEFTFRTVTQIP